MEGVSYVVDGVSEGYRRIYLVRLRLYAVCSYDRINGGVVAVEDDVLIDVALVERKHSKRRSNMLRRWSGSCKRT